MAFTGTYFPHIQQISFKPLNNSSSTEYGTLHAATLSVASPQEPPDKDISASSSDSGSGSGQTANSDESTGSNYLGILDTDLTALTSGQKNFFMITVTILCCMSLVGNASTLIVNFRRKIRPFFRACLISLAFSDLMNTLFLSTAYLSQFTEEYVQTWRLGPLMCSLVPFATTAAILASSMTLVGIAVDRYYAVMKSVIGFWNPTVISCIVCMLCIWLGSIGIACPVFTIYNLQPVYILTQDHATDVSVAATMPTTTTPTSTAGDRVVTTRLSTSTSATIVATKTTWEENASQEQLSYTLIKQEKLVDICISDQKDVSLYYVVVFVIIFIPCIGAFFWFNIIIARKLWKRRLGATNMKRKGTPCEVQPKTQLPAQPPIEPQNPQYQCGNYLKPPIQNFNCGSGHTSSTTMGSGNGSNPTATTTSSSNATCPSVTAPKCNSREARHLRMFTIILLMMAVFVFLRLPAWTFLLMRLYGSYNKPLHWILYYVFGIMNLASSVLNPLFYTFLTETIQYALRVKTQVTAFICGSCTKCCCCCCNSVKEERNENTKTSFPATVGNVEEEPSLAPSCCENFCGCCGFLRAICFKPQTLGQRVHTPGPVGDDFGAKDSSDRDEGVDCSEEIEEDMGDFDRYKQRIYSIYPESLVSSSLNSK